MKCADVSSKLADYTDGELNFWDSLPIALHLTSCKHCKNELSRILMLNHRISGSLSQSKFADVDLKDSILAALPNGIYSRPGHLSHRQRLAVRLACAISALVFTVVMLDNMPSQERNCIMDMQPLTHKSPAVIDYMNGTFKQPSYQATPPSNNAPNFTDTPLKTWDDTLKSLQQKPPVDSSNDYAERQLDSLFSGTDKQAE